VIGEPNSNSGNAVFVVGLLLMLVAVPLGCVALVFASGGEMIASESRTDLFWTAFAVAFAVLMFGAGAALLRASRSGRYGLVVGACLLMVIDFAALGFVTWLQRRPEPPVYIPPPDPHAVIKAPVVLSSQKAELRLIKCSPKDRRCRGAPIGH
jgi:hypothetical protein